MDVGSTHLGKFCETLSATCVPKSPKQLLVAGPVAANCSMGDSLIFVKKERHDAFELNALCAEGMGQQSRRLHAKPNLTPPKHLAAYSDAEV
ncbi:MAG: hypothetical protein ABSF60_11085 [Verrucomicrobiota bacterium]